jgi:hypothetical protein
VLTFRGYLFASSILGVGSPFTTEMRPLPAEADDSLDGNSAGVEQSLFDTTVAHVHGFDAGRGVIDDCLDGWRRDRRF